MLVSESPGSVINSPDGINSDVTNSDAITRSGMMLTGGQAATGERTSGDSAISTNAHSSKVGHLNGWLSAPELLLSEGHSHELSSDIAALLEDSKALSTRPYDTVKRGIDLIGASLLLTTLSPVMAAVALLVRASSPGPVVYRQRRLTLGGKIFTMFKFRTMRTDAEAGTGAVWAADADPRITSLGKILRKTRLDELPQLFNVIAGDMSLIGPRPERPELAEELEKLLPGFQKRLAVRAGISGLAQVASGYAACVSSYRRKLAFDLYYVAKRSALLDLKIALKTITTIITGQGAR